MLGFDSIAKRQVKLAIQCPSVLLLLLEALNASSSDFPFGHIIQRECSLAERCEKRNVDNYVLWKAGGSSGRADEVIKTNMMD